MSAKYGAFFICDSVVESRHKYLWIFRACSWTPIGVYVVFLFFFAELFFQQADALGQFFYGWELVLNLFDFYVVVRGNAHWGCDAVECILDFCLVFVAADQQAHGRILSWGLDEVINGIDIEVEFPGKLRLEWYCFEFYDYVAVERDVEKEHIQFAGLACNDELLLSAHICESGSELEQEARELLFEFGFQLFFFISFWKRNESEIVCVFGYSLS